MIQAIFPVIADQWQIVFGILLLLALGQALIILVLKKISSNQLTSTEYLSLGMAGWILPVALISLVWFLFGFKPASPFNLFILISLLVLLIYFLLRFKIDPKPESKSTGFILLLFFFISVLLRLPLFPKQSCQALLSYLLDLSVSQSSSLMPLHSKADFRPA